MLYISNALYLAGVASNADTANRPLIGWKSVLTVNDFESEDGEGAGVLWSPSTYTTWESVAKTGDDIEFIVNLNNPTASPVDYVGIAGHNFHVIHVFYRIQHSFDGVTWFNTTTLGLSSDGGAIFLHFNSVTALYFRLYITTSTDEEINVSIAHIRMGQVLMLQREMYVGISPFTLNKRVEKVVTVSDGGKYLGSVATSTVNLYSIPQLDNLPDFVREEIDDFLDHCDLIGPSWNNGPDGTFFAAWRPGEYPDEVLYCHPPTQLQRPVNQRNNGMMQWSISGEAEA